VQVPKEEGQEQSQAHRLQVLLAALKTQAGVWYTALAGETSGNCFAYH
jgi:hypothetical protein